MVFYNDLIFAGYRRANNDAGQAYVVNVATGNVDYTFDNPAPVHSLFGQFGRNGAFVGPEGHLLLGDSTADLTGTNEGQVYLFHAGNTLPPF